MRGSLDVTARGPAARPSCDSHLRAAAPAESPKQRTHADDGGGVEGSRSARKRTEGEYGSIAPRPVTDEGKPARLVRAPIALPGWDRQLLDQLSVGTIRMHPVELKPLLFGVLDPEDDPAPVR